MDALRRDYGGRPTGAYYDFLGQVGVVAGIVAALVGEVLSRLLLVRGDTHIDPPAGAIAIISLFGLIPLALAG